MNIALWVVQVLVGLAFLMAGGMKTTQGKQKLASTMGWVEDFSDRTARGIGTLEILGGLGVILPALTGILPWLTPLAAGGLVLTMIGAAITHIRRKEHSQIVPGLGLMLLAIIVLVGRSVTLPR